MILFFEKNRQNKGVLRSLISRIFQEVKLLTYIGFIGGVTCELKVCKVGS